MDTPPHDLAVAEITTTAPRAAKSRAAPPARPTPKPAITLDSPERFINRELSWLDFNHRVVEEAENPHHPLLERVRFVSISASNLDEFYSVRVAGLIGQAKAGVTVVSPDGRSPAQQLIEIKQRTDLLLAEQQQAWRDLRDALRDAELEVCEGNQLSNEDMAWLDAWFMERVFPVLTPLAIDPAHPFPFIPNMGLVMALLLLFWRRAKLMVLPAAIALALPAVTGHAALASPAGFAAIGTILDGVHLLTAGFWIGGLVVLAALFRRKEPNMLLALSLFSDWAMIAVLLLVMTGLIDAAQVLLGGKGALSPA